MVHPLYEKWSEILKPIEEEQNASAAVALLLNSVHTHITVLFVKRVNNPADPWSGQMALPGGKQELDDQNLKDTVIRETAEETGINLEECQFLGVLEAVTSAPRPDMKILPFVILCEHEPIITLNEKELEGFFWISLNDLIYNRGTIDFGFGEFPAYIVGDTIIWGLTYRIMERFFRTIGFPAQR